MDYLGLAIGLALPWILGWSVLLACGWPHTESIDYHGVTPLRLGYGYLIGALSLTLWMRALSAAGMLFGWITVGLPLAAACALLLGWSWRSGRLVWRFINPKSLLPSDRWQRLFMIGLMIWMALRFGSLAVEMAWRPLYPWDAWTEWATKARVWYELGRIVPFVSRDAWLAGASGAYLDASPANPATVPLLQVWSCVALGRWDDSAMNWPWLMMLAALVLWLYGALRDFGTAPLAALVGAWLLLSLPLLDAQVALAGYPDLMLACSYALAALSLCRWSLRRKLSDACMALVFALCCPLIESSGVAWTLTLLPGVVVALRPERGARIVGIALGTFVLLLSTLGRWDMAIFGRQLGVDFAPTWRSLIDGFFLFDNWHLLWYGAIGLTIVGARHLVRPPLSPLAMTAGAGLVFVFLVSSYPAIAAWTGDSTAISRAALPLAPLLICLGVLLWNELTRPAPERIQTSATGDALPTTADA